MSFEASFLKEASQKSLVLEFKTQIETYVGFWRIYIYILYTMALWTAGSKKSYIVDHCSVERMGEEVKMKKSNGDHWMVERRGGKFK